MMSKTRIAGAALATAAALTAGATLSLGLGSDTAGAVVIEAAEGGLIDGAAEGDSVRFAVISGDEATAAAEWAAANADEIVSHSGHDVWITRTNGETTLAALVEDRFFVTVTGQASEMDPIVEAIASGDEEAVEALWDEAFHDYFDGDWDWDHDMDWDGDWDLEWDWDHDMDWDWDGDWARDWGNFDGDVTITIGGSEFSFDMGN